MKSLAGYLRVSHVGGRDQDPSRFHSPEEQTEEIEGWARAHNHRVEFLKPELDRKGGDASRPILRQAIEGVKAGRYGGVVVAYLSRAGRDLRLMLDLWDEVEGAGGVVYFAREKIDGSTPSSRLQRNLLASIAQHELEERREGFERACKGAVERGIWQRRQTPRGYDRDKSSRRLIVNDAAEDVRWAANELLSGKPILGIAKVLGMTGGGVRAMLRNRVYLGELKVRSYVNPDAHEPILDPEIFAAVQDHLDNAARPARDPANEKALLAGLARCVSCGHVMTRSGKNRSRNYICPTHHSGGKCPRPAAISCRRLDEHVEAAAILALENLRVAARTGDRVLAARQEVRDAEVELSAYLEAVDMAGVDSSDAAAGMRSRREKLDAAKEALQAEMAKVPRLPLIEGGSAVWETLTVSERNDLLRSLLAAVLVRPVGPGRLVSVAERARVLRHGADISLPRKRGSDPFGIIALPWPDADNVDVIRVPSIEESL